MFLKSFSGNSLINTASVTAFEIIDRGDGGPPGQVPKSWNRYRIIARFGFQAGVTLYETAEETVAKYYLNSLLERLNDEEIPDNDYEDNEYDGQLWNIPD